MEGKEVVVLNETEKLTQVFGRISPKKRVTWKWGGGGGAELEAGESGWGSQ